MIAYSRHTELTPALGKITALLIASLLPALSAGCVQQTAAQPGLVAQLDPSPRAMGQMQILMTETGDVTTVLNGDNHELPNTPGHQGQKEHTYDFGTAGDQVCFWEESMSESRKQYCWPKPGSAWIFLNPNGHITGARQTSGQDIQHGDHSAMKTKNWFYGRGTPFCFWTAFGACYCWDV